jgi:hypothetical protein
MFEYALVLGSAFMPQELFPSSYLCDCGHQSHFFERTVREAKRKSYKKPIYLLDSAPDEHTIVFAQGEMIAIICPRSKIDTRESSNVTDKAKRRHPHGRPE